MIDLAPHAEGTLLGVKAQPGAKRNAISGQHDGRLKVSVCQAAEKDKANRALAEVLCEQLGLRPGQLDLLGGQTSAQKRFLVRGISTQQLAQRIEAVLAALAKGKRH